MKFIITMDIENYKMMDSDGQRRPVTALLKALAKLQTELHQFDAQAFDRQKNHRLRDDRGRPWLSLMHSDVNSRES